MLIMNPIINQDPDSAGWDDGTEEDHYDRPVAYQKAVRLTYELRKRWVDDLESTPSPGIHTGQPAVSPSING